MNGLVHMLLILRTLRRRKELVGCTCSLREYGRNLTFLGCAAVCAAVLSTLLWLLLRFVAKDIQRRVPRMETDGAELLQQMLVYEPNSRITCAQALQLPYFQCVDLDTAKHVAGQRSAPSPP